MVSVILDGSNQILDSDEKTYWEIASPGSSGWEDMQFWFEDIDEFEAEIRRRLE